MSRAGSILASILVAMLITSCGASSKLVGSWQSDSYGKRQLRKVLVIAVTPDKRVRTIIEEEFVEQFADRKVQALSSITLMGSQTEINKENVLKAIDETGIDAVFAIKMAEQKTEGNETPGVTNDYSEPPRYYYNFYDYQERSSATSSASGYTETSEVYMLESNLYDAGTADLMWTATTKTTDPKSAEDAVPPLSRVLMKALDRGGFFR